MTVPAAGPPHPLRRAARILSWLTLVAVAFVTLSPIAFRPETPFGADQERFAAFAAVGVLLTLGTPRHRLGWFLGLLAVAGLLEAAQTLVAGRHGRLHDAEVKAAGAVAGAVVALWAEMLAGRIAGASRGARG